MFGESDSESPRVGSPWDPLISSSPSPSTNAELEVKKHLGECFPKLVPEVEYGNVEYKLKLLNPSSERFTRLVTQMKWRLLEGGGQAYYELGVADSGQLVGLSRKDLEQSLETLEMMAGEIGASVIVVKEIEVPAALVGSRMNFTLGIPQRTPGPVITEGEIEASTTTETETDDDDTSTSLGLDTPPNTIAYRQTHFAAARSHPERPALQSSPAILPIQNLAAASVDAELDADAIFRLDFEIEIASVYKPRPHRSRPAAIVQPKYAKRNIAPKVKKQQPPHANLNPTAKAEERRLKRDARRDARRKALLMTDTAIEEPQKEIASQTAMQHASKTATELRDLHVRLDPVQSAVHPEKCDADADETNVTDITEPRLIVEALVVRKLALEEAFLDFAGFSLEI